MTFTTTFGLSSPIPVNVLNQVPVTQYIGLEFWLETQSAGSPGVEITLLSTTVAVGKSLHLHQVRVASRISGKWRVIAGGTTIVSGFTGAGYNDGDFIWQRDRVIATGTLIEVKFTTRTGGPIADVDAYLGASEV